MKQFLCTRTATGRRHGPYRLVVAAGIAGSGAAQWLDLLPVGGGWIDADGDEWTRLGDVPDELPTTDHAKVGRQNLQRAEQSERLERIALAYLAVLGPAYFADTFRLKTGFSLAQACADNARELIAELDKPEGNPFEAGL